MTIWEKLQKIKCELRAPKDNYNEFGKFAYRNAEGILAALKPLEEKYNVVVRVTDELTESGGNSYIKATVFLQDLEDSSASVSASAFAREAESKKGMDTMQITGCASSYARKYALSALFCIDNEKDSDAYEPEKEYICADCGRVLKAKKVNGMVYEPEQVAENAKKVHKRVLCFDCFNAANRKMCEQP